MRYQLNLTRVALVAAALVAACDRPQAGPAAILASSTSDGMPSVTADLAIPASVHTTSTMSGCDNSPGPYITISGEFALGGLGSRLIFRNNDKGTHTYTDETHNDVTVVPSGDAVSIPKQPVQGGVGGNPFIWIQFTDDQDAPMSQEIYLGRCVQGLSVDAGVEFSAVSRALATFDAEGCYNNPGPTITLGGDLRVHPGVNARFIFRNNDNPVGGPHEFDDATLVRVTLVPPGHDVEFPKQPVLGGVGGNPWISFQFLSGTGATLTDEYALGRCVQLTKTT
jgi:hypothetical protein